MNDLIINLGHNQIFNDLPPYLDYTLYMLNKSFKILNKYNNQIIELLILVDKQDIHPSIFQSLYANIIFSIYIIEFSVNPQLISNQVYLESITNIYPEIDILISIFNDIFINVDEQYKSDEAKLCYNSMNSLSNNDFLELIDNVENIVDNNIKILNTLIIQIEHLTQQNIIEYLATLDNEKVIDSSLSSDKILYDKITNEFNQNMINNYRYITKFETFNKIKNIDILKFEQKNSIYFWIDHIAFINSNRLKSILGSKY